jgi:hypothetical protein
MSLVSMLAMEFTENLVTLGLVDKSMSLADPQFWAVTVVSMLAGFLAPLPYNYWRLKALGKACHWDAPRLWAFVVDVHIFDVVGVAPWSLNASVVIPHHFEKWREVLAIESGLKLIPTPYGQSAPSREEDHARRTGSRHLPVREYQQIRCSPLQDVAIMLLPNNTYLSVTSFTTGRGTQNWNLKKLDGHCHKLILIK